MALTRADIYHNLAILLSSGVPLHRALRTASGHVRSPLAVATRRMAEQLDRGLAGAMARHPRAFSRLDVVTIEAAERSGDLTEVLESLADWYRFRLRMRRTIITNMIYPIILLHAAVFIPSFPPLLLGQISGAAYLLGAASILGCFYLPVVVVYALYRFTPQTGPIRLLMDAIWLHVPLLGGALRNLALSRYCRTFHLLYGAGVPIVESSRTAAELVGNAAVSRLLMKGARSAKAGQPVSAGLPRSLPPEFVQAWEVGEESGSLEEVSLRLANLTGERAEMTLADLARIVPRILYILIVIFVAVRVVTFYAGLYGMQF